MASDEGIFAVDDSYTPPAPAWSDYTGSNTGATQATSPSFEALVDQVAQNNLWSAEQAERQMKFQEDMYNRSLEFNHNEAEINREFQQDSATRAMAFSSAENAKNRAWQKMMSDTAHQREVQDLISAGLNPILAANNGASAGTGSAAMSGQAAGYGASSSGSPSGAKGNGDQSGTMAIVSLLGKMMDNEIAREQMQNSAEVAANTADVYTAATRYAAELAMIASEYSADRHTEASYYGSDKAYEQSLNNPMNILGDIIQGFLSSSNAGSSSGLGKVIHGTLADGMSAVARAVVGGGNKAENLGYTKKGVQYVVSDDDSLFGRLFGRKVISIKK